MGGSSLAIDQSMLLSSISQSGQVPATKQPLAVKLEATVEMVAAHVILSEDMHDRIFEANIPPEERNQAKGLESRFGASHYSLAIADISTLVEITNTLRKPKDSSTLVTEHTEKVLTLKCTVGGCSGARFDLKDGPHPRVLDLQRSDHFSSHYESVGSSNMFRSAQEFYVLTDSRSSVVISGSQKRGTQ
jgi:hypothetical protein